MSAAATHRALPLVLAALPAHRGSQRSLIPHVMRLTHPRGRWPSSWPNPGVRLVSTPLLPLLYRFDTLPSSSSFGTSLLVYRLLPLSSNICLRDTAIDSRACCVLSSTHHRFYALLVFVS